PEFSLLGFPLYLHPSGAIFDPPVTIRYRFNPTSAAAARSGYGNASRTALFVWEPTAGTWVEKVGSTAGGAGEVSVQTASFSFYAVSVQTASFSFYAVLEVRGEQLAGPGFDQGLLLGLSLLGAALLLALLIFCWLRYARRPEEKVMPPVEMSHREEREKPTVEAQLLTSGAEMDGRFLDPSDRLFFASGHAAHDEHTVVRPGAPWLSPTSLAADESAIFPGGHATLQSPHPATGFLDASTLSAYARGVTAPLFSPSRVPGAIAPLPHPLPMPGAIPLPGMGGAGAGGGMGGGMASLEEEEEEEEEEGFQVEGWSLPAPEPSP
ncbi:hypothetical protein T484DRAFT_1848114, partial [Baffinella frigidus]